MFKMYPGILGILGSTHTADGIVLRQETCSWTAKFRVTVEPVSSKPLSDLHAPVAYASGKHRRYALGTVRQVGTLY
jgi:hypothetical protein